MLRSVAIIILARGPARRLGVAEEFAERPTPLAGPRARRRSTATPPPPAWQPFTPRWAAETGCKRRSRARAPRFQDAPFGQLRSWTCGAQRSRGRGPRPHSVRAQVKATTGPDNPLGTAQTGSGGTGRRRI